MLLKCLGAIMIIAGCGGFALRIAVNYRQKENNLRNFINALDFMECELQFRMSALPELCRLTAQECNGSLKQLFVSLAVELEDQVSPSVSQCVKAVLVKEKGVSDDLKESFQLLGDHLGRFDLKGQLKGLQNVRQTSRLKLSRLTKNSQGRIRSYQTLGLCAGAALVILLM